MDHVCILDCETTGTGDEDVAIEVAATIFSVKHACAIRSFSSLIRASSNPAEAVNRIPAAALLEAPEPAPVWARVREMAGKCGAAVAHNSDFDSRFVPPDVTGTLPWVCSMDDLLWPRQTKPGMNLVALALAHDLGVASAHRASADVELLVRLFARAAELGADLQAMIQRGLRPKGVFVSSLPFERNEENKAHGFVWDRIVPKRWARRCAIDDGEAIPFAQRWSPCAGADEPVAHQVRRTR